jgi:phosphomannomutase
MISFGTGGWRGIIGDNFTFENVRRVAKALSILAKSKCSSPKPIVVGYDMRFMSRSFAEAFAEVLAYEGIEVWLMSGPAPTPMVMFAVEHERLDYGATITASHNPPQYNGIKVIVEKGKDAPIEVTDELESIIRSLSDEQVAHGAYSELVEKGQIRMYSNRNQYIDALLAQVDMEAIQKRAFRVLFNPMYGTAKDIMMVCLSSLRCKVEMINFKPDLINTRSVPCPERHSLRDMEWMMEDGIYDLGIATDGDSDRIALYDQRGAYVSADTILCLLYYYLKEYRTETGGIVRNLTTTHILDSIAESYGEPVYEVPVGFKHIAAKMEECNLLLGGESSGGVMIRGHINGKDGILAALLCIEMMATTGKSLSELAHEIEEKYGARVSYSMSLPIAGADGSHISSVLFGARYVPKFPKPVEKTSYMDGVKFYFADGSWCCLRFSGTEPVLRVFMEMKSREEAMEFAEALNADEALNLNRLKS